MRVLFDQATPVPIRTFLIGHTVRTAAQEHWDTLAALLKLTFRSTERLPSRGAK